MNWFKHLGTCDILPSVEYTDIYNPINDYFIVRETNDVNDRCRDDRTLCINYYYTSLRSCTINQTVKCGSRESTPGAHGYLVLDKH